MQKRATADAVPATTALTTPATKRPKTERGYYLMKSEADVFSIDDLAARMNQTEPWDGTLYYLIVEEQRWVMFVLLCVFAPRA